MLNSEPPFSPSDRLARLNKLLGYKQQVKALGERVSNARAKANDRSEPPAAAEAAQALLAADTAVTALLNTADLPALERGDLEKLKPEIDSGLRDYVGALFADVAMARGAAAVFTRDYFETLPGSLVRFGAFFREQPEFRPAPKIQARSKAKIPVRPGTKPKPTGGNTEIDPLEAPRVSWGLVRAATEGQADEKLMELHKNAVARLKQLEPPPKPKRRWWIFIVAGIAVFGLLAFAILRIIPVPDPGDHDLRLTVIAMQSQTVTPTPTLTPTPTITPTATPSPTRTNTPIPTATAKLVVLTCDPVLESTGTYTDTSQIVIGFTDTVTATWKLKPGKKEDGACQSEDLSGYYFELRPDPVDDKFASQHLIFQGPAHVEQVASDLVLTATFGLQLPATGRPERLQESPQYILYVQMAAEGEKLQSVKVSLAKLRLYLNMPLANPTPTATPTRTPTPTPLATLTPAVTSTPTCVPESAISITLSEPTDGYTAQPGATFKWSYTGPTSLPGYFFEVRAWYVSSQILTPTPVVVARDIPMTKGEVPVSNLGGSGLQDGTVYYWTMFLLRPPDQCQLQATETRTFVYKSKSEVPK